MLTHNTDVAVEIKIPEKHDTIYIHDRPENVYINV